MKLKPGVDMTGIKPELILGLVVADFVYSTFDVEMVVTSLLDGRHSLTSLHYAGCAADLRTRNIPEGLRKQVRDDIAAALPNDFDVVLESNHIHMEWQPRRRST